jgi:hypothetical protein
MSRFEQATPQALLVVKHYGDADASYTYSKNALVVNCSTDDFDHQRINILLVSEVSQKEDAVYIDYLDESTCTISLDSERDAKTLLDWLKSVVTYRSLKALTERYVDDFDVLDITKLKDGIDCIYLRAANTGGKTQASAEYHYEALVRFDGYKRSQYLMATDKAIRAFYTDCVNEKDIPCDPDTATSTLI